MGSDAEIYVFDHDAYIGRVVPGIRRLLLDGTLEQWLLATHEKHSKHLGPELDKLLQLHSTDLARDCTYLGNDLSFDASLEPLVLDWNASRNRRACTRANCPSRTSCPWHHDNDPSAAEELAVLLQLAVGSECLLRSQFVGRTMTIGSYRDVLKTHRVPREDPVWILLHKLGTRGFVVGYDWGGSYEGIHGWLNPAETKALFLRLDALALPRFPMTFDAMEQFRATKPGPYISPEGFSFEELSLSFVRTVAGIAAPENKGVLWGNDTGLLE